MEASDRFTSTKSTQNHMAQPLDDAEIRRRLARLANLERLHEDLRAKYEKLKQENELLKAAIAAQNILIESLKLRIEELERMVFGRRKKKHPDPDDGGPQGDTTPQKPPVSRAPDSCRRPVPPADAVTSTEEHSLTHCRDCGAKLQVEGAGSGAGQPRLDQRWRRYHRRFVSSWEKQREGEH